MSILLSLNFFCSASSCCWIEGMVSNSTSPWNVEAVISLKKRSSNLVYNANRVNTPSQIGFVPLIQHNRNQINLYSLPVSQVRGSKDEIQCRWAASFKEGGGIWKNRVGTLSKVSNVVSLWAMIVLMIIYLYLASAPEAPLFPNISFRVTAEPLGRCENLFVW